MSRRYYLAKFQGAEPDEFTRDEFKAAAEKCRELHPIERAPGIQRGYSQDQTDATKCAETHKLLQIQD